MSKQMQVASRQLLAIMSNHLLVCSFILFAQVGLRLISPLVSILLMHVTLVRMAECTWSLQAKTMHIWHPAVQLFFCVSRMVYGAVGALVLFLWARVFCRMVL